MPVSYGKYIVNARQSGPKVSLQRKIIWIFFTLLKVPLASHPKSSFISAKPNECLI